MELVKNIKQRINNKKYEIKYYLKTKLGYELSPSEEFNLEDIEYYKKYKQSLYGEFHPKYHLERCFKDDFFRKIPKKELIDFCIGFKPNTYPYKKFHKIMKKYNV